MWNGSINGSVTTVGACRARSASGCFDMTGNVREWVSYPGFEDDGVLRVPVLGGSFAAPPETMQIYSSIPIEPVEYDDATGFRVASLLFAPQDSLPLQILAASPQAPSHFRLTVIGRPGGTAALDVSTNLQAWTTVLTGFPLTGLPQTLIRTPTGARLFYRLREE